jgi:GNAT superfamily N-acetyltransferase
LRTQPYDQVHLPALSDLVNLHLAAVVPGWAIPAPRGWAELSEVHVAEGWRNRRVGSWLVGTAAGWLRLCRRDRVVLAVNEDDEAAGAGRFYRRFGWDVLAREIRPWPRDID